MSSDTLFRRILFTGATLVPALLLSAAPASAEVFEFACQVVGISNPTTQYYKVDVQASTVTELSDSRTYHASITPTSIDWSWRPGSTNDTSSHLDRLSGLLTVTDHNPVRDNRQDSNCHKTSGF
jgi:hypothetical protein